MTDWKSSLRSNPIPWLLDTASAPIRFRVLSELLDRGRDDPDLQQARLELADDRFQFRHSPLQLAASGAVAGRSSHT